MADKKRNIFKDKLNQHVEGGPQNADWAAMNSMIDAHPSLNKRKKRGVLFRFVIFVSVLLIALSAIIGGYWAYQFGQNATQLSEQSANNKTQTGKTDSEFSETGAADELEGTTETTRTGEEDSDPSANSNEDSSRELENDMSGNRSAVKPEGEFDSESAQNNQNPMPGMRVLQMRLKIMTALNMNKTPR